MNRHMRYLITATTLVISLAACSPRPAHFSTPKVEDCTPLVAHNDERSDAEWDAFLEGADSTIDYIGKGNRPTGIWITNDPGETPRIIGYAMAEDAAIYPSAACAADLTN